MNPRFLTLSAVLALALFGALATPLHAATITKASWYGEKFHGKRTASGEIYNQHSYTAAHRTLPFGTKVRVTNLANKKSVVVRINNRGPFISGRGIDLSYAAARKIDMIRHGVVRVKIEQI